MKVCIIGGHPDGYTGWSRITREIIDVIDNRYRVSVVSVQDDAGRYAYNNQDISVVSVCEHPSIVRDVINASDVQVSLVDNDTARGIVSDQIPIINYGPIDTPFFDPSRCLPASVTISPTYMSYAIYSRNPSCHVRRVLRYRYCWTLKDYEHEPIRRAVRSELGLPKPYSYVWLYHAAWSWRKGYEYLLDAWSTYHAMYPHDRLIVLCNGYPYHHARDGMIIMDTPLSDDHLLSIYLASDIFLSLSKGEGVCYPFIDACTTGMSIVVPDHTSFSDHIEHRGESEYFFRIRGWYKGHVMDSPDMYYCKAEYPSVVDHMSYVRVMMPFIPPSIDQRQSIGYERLSMFSDIHEQEQTLLNLIEEVTK